MSMSIAKKASTRFAAALVMRQSRMPNQLRGAAAILLLLTACVSLNTSSSTSDGPSSRAEVISAIEATERARKVAANAGDNETALRYIDSDFVFVHSTGQVDNVERFRSFAERVGRRDEPRRIEEPTYLIAENVAVRTQLTSAPPRPNLPEARIRSLDVYIQRNGVWKWLAHQSSMIRPPWAEIPVAPAVLEEYAGTYLSNAGQSRSYRLENSKLVQAPQRAGDSPMMLTAISVSTFAIGDAFTTVTFLRNSSGQVATAQVVGPWGISIYRRIAG